MLRVEDVVEVNVCRRACQLIGMLARQRDSFSLCLMRCLPLLATILEPDLHAAWSDAEALGELHSERLRTGQRATLHSEHAEQGLAPPLCARRALTGHGRGSVSKTCSRTETWRQEKFCRFLVFLAAGAGSSPLEVSSDSERGSV